MRVCGTLSLSDGAHLTSAEMFLQIVAAVLVVIVLFRTTYKYRTQQNSETDELSAFQVSEIYSLRILEFIPPITILLVVGYIFCKAVFQQCKT